MPSLYEITLPPFIRGLKNLSRNLAKGRAFADGQGMAHEDLLGARLYPDMLPLTAQVQRASDTPRLAAVRIGGVAPKPMADEEKTFDELQARIAATLDYLKAVPADAFDGKESNPVSFKAGPRELTFPTATVYAQVFALPNFYFHAVTAYDILRHKGVPLGKADFIAADA